MVLTINPAVSGGTRKWLIDSLMFFAGAFVGGLTSIVAVALLTHALSVVVSGKIVFVIAVALALAGMSRDLGLPIPLPYRPQQVPEEWRTFLPTSVVAVAFGAMLGFGFITLFTFYAHLAAMTLVPFVSPLVALGMAAALALGKTMSLVLALGTTTLQDVEDRVERAPARRSLLRLTSAVLSAVTVLVILGHGPP